MQALWGAHRAPVLTFYLPLLRFGLGPEAISRPMRCFSVFEVRLAMFFSSASSKAASFCFHSASWSGYGLGGAYQIFTVLSWLPHVAMRWPSGLKATLLTQ